MDFTAEAITSKRGITLFKVVMKKEDGRILQKTLDLPTFSNLIDNSKVVDETFFHLDKSLVPEGYVDGWFASPQTYSVVWRVKGKKRQFVLSMGMDKTKHFSIPFPDLVMALSVRDGVKQYFSVYASKEGSNELYNYPFGNVQTGTGAVCMGNIRTKDMTPQLMEEDFFLGITNNDYYSNGNGRIPMKWSQEKLAKELSKLDAFPENWLVESGVTLENLIKKSAR